MSIKPTSRSAVWVIAFLLCLLLIAMLVSCSTAEPTSSAGTSSGEDDESSGAAGQIGNALDEGSSSVGDSSDDDNASDTCPKGPIFMDVEMIEGWKWSPGGIKELGVIDGWGKVTCMVEVSGSKVTGEVGCYFIYYNDGDLQGDSGKCDVTGQGIALAKIKGSCDNFTLKLEISEFVEPDPDTGDIPMSASLVCAGKTSPYLTYFPLTWFEIEVPLAAGEFEYDLPKEECSMEFIECDKIYYFRVRDPGFHE